MPYTTTVKLAGVTFANPDGSARQDILGTLFDDYWTEGLEDEIEIELRPEPANKYDPHAVAVWCVAPKEAAGQIGYVPTESSGAITTAIREGRLSKVDMDDLGCARGNRIWARIKIHLRSEDGSPEEPFEGADFFEDSDGTTYRVLG